MCGVFAHVFGALEKRLTLEPWSFSNSVVTDNIQWIAHDYPTYTVVMVHGPCLRFECGDGQGYDQLEEYLKEKPNSN